MYTFKKGSDTAHINKNKVQLHISIEIIEIEGTHLIEIPSLNISSYSISKDNIDKRIDESVASFFKYWLKIEGEEKFIEYMLSLGFSLSKPSKNIPKKSINSEERKKLIESLLGLGYSLSSSTPTKTVLSGSKIMNGQETKRTLDEELVIHD